MEIWREDFQAVYCQLDEGMIVVVRWRLGKTFPWVPWVCGRIFDGGECLPLIEKNPDETIQDFLIKALRVSEEEVTNEDDLSKVAEWMAEVILRLQLPVRLCTEV